ncbi:hypothetical protein FACS189493_3130 [Spirochaetia bacterium]|nr:hypothetical protein FACS189493_3130 [Spirochaetia bacterium]
MPWVLNSLWGPVVRVTVLSGGPSGVTKSPPQAGLSSPEPEWALPRQAIPGAGLFSRRKGRSP